MNVLTVATRGGRLAIAQTEIVASALKKNYPVLQIETKKITTRGDRDRRTALWNLKDTGFFTSRVEDALLTSDADFAVHSFKDLPTRQREGLTIAAVCQRQFAEDCLIAADSVDSIDELRQSAKIGTSSLRRAAQLRRLRADLKPTSIRGNVLTRIRRLEEGKFDAIILARAGIERLGLADKISFSFDPEQFIPAPAQGALAVQTRTDDTATTNLIAAINDKNASTVTLAERHVLTTMQCGCHAPVGAFAKIDGDDIEITAFISDLQGKNFIRRRIKGPTEQPAKLAEKLAKQLLSSGGSEILASLEQ
ncbi:MAG: hydroxymethylbilane synthase [Planctomycetota bacterium]|jgi:hydroxymethylbilane synthase